VMLRCESKSQEDNQKFLNEMTQLLRQHSGDLIDIWGPIPAPMERKAGRFQAHVVLLSTERAKLHFYVREWWQQVLFYKPSSMKLTIDVDPQELS
nr:primosomal protein N' [Acinetobacter sp.]